MEFLFTQFRSRKSASSKPLSLGTSKGVGLGLILTFSDYPSDDNLHILLNTSNLILALTETKQLPPNPSTNAEKKFPLHDTNLIMPNCIFFSQAHYMPKIFSSDPNYCCPIDITPRLDSAVMKLLPMTKCLQHGNSGFLPYNYVKRLPEYTRITHHKPVPKVVHLFDECVLEFPLKAYHPVSSSKQNLHEILLMRKYCYQCYLTFSRQNDFHMLSPRRRGEVMVTRYWYRKMIKALDRYLSSVAELENHDDEEEETIFILDT